MPTVAEHAARLYYDDACGPCRLLARASEGASRHRVVAMPLDAAASERDLGAMPGPERFGSAHLAAGGRLRSGEAMTEAWVGLTVGPAGTAVLRRLPVVERALRGVYRRLWTYRNAHGCGATAHR